jgi:GMP synthase (glutamine-hydrolysing)
LIAASLGCRVYPAPATEIGWHPVDVLPAAARSRTFAGMPTPFRPFHWHGDTFDLPAGALHLASTAVCENQAFEIEFDGGPDRGGALVVALQFHLEATEESVRAMVAADAAALASAPGSPTPGALLSDPTRWSANRPLLEELLDRLTA